MSKIRGYIYEIVEMFPVEDAEHGIRHLTSHDRLEDAEKVLAVLDSVNYNWTCYAMMMRPVWDDEHVRREAKELAEKLMSGPCDHNGSTTTVTTNGEITFSCPKCGLRQSGVMGSKGPS